MVSHFVFDFLALLLRHPAELDRVARHAQRHALLQPTILAAIPVDPIDNAILLSGTLVVHNSRLAASEKALATLAGYDTVMDARRLVAANLAGYDFDLS